MVPRGGKTMKTMRERHGKTPLQMDFDVIIKKAHCGFDQLIKRYDEKMAKILADLCGETERKAA